VVDLQIQPGKVTALVSGSEVYEVGIDITALPEGQWRSLKSRCAGQISSAVELLQGRLAAGVIGIVTARDGGLFPKPREIKMECSCPDWAGMCKHVAAVLYGVGARLDHQPELLFLLRNVDHLELIEEAVSRAGAKTATRKKTLAQDELAGVFGIELAEPDGPAPTEEVAKPKGRKAAKAKPAAKPEATEAAPAAPEPAAKPKGRKPAKAKPAKSKPAEEVVPPEPKPASKPRRAPRARKGKEGDPEV
jgi:uncharacterized Zn finger protein